MESNNCLNLLIVETHLLVTNVSMFDLDDFFESEWVEMLVLNPGGTSKYFYM
jgi:hypothetical protein